MFPKQGFACLFLLSLLSFSPPSPALAAPESGADARLNALEVKLFTHAYLAEADATRVARLERFVFGAVKDETNLPERILNLTSAVNIRKSYEVPYLPRQKADSDWSPSQTGQLSRSARLPGSSYPRVTDLEERLFAQSFVSEPVASRLDRLEWRMFGRKSGNSDLAVRVDTLVAVVVPAPQLLPIRLRSIACDRHAKASAAQSGDAGARAGAGAGTGSVAESAESGASSYRTNFFALFRAPELQAREQVQSPCTVVDQIEYLENAAFGRIRPNKTLQKRVSALEEKFYGTGKLDSNKDLSSRVARLFGTVSGGSHAADSRKGA